MKPIEGLATSLAVARLREAGHGGLAEQLIDDFKQLQAERDRARDLAVMLEQVCAHHKLEGDVL